MKLHFYFEIFFKIILHVQLFQIFTGSYKVLYSPPPPGGGDDFKTNWEAFLKGWKEGKKKREKGRKRRKEGKKGEK